MKMDESVKNLVDSLENDPNASYRAYCENFYGMDTSDLDKIIRSLLWSIRSLPGKEFDNMCKAVAKELKDHYY